MKTRLAVAVAVALLGLILAGCNLLGGDDEPEPTATTGPARVTPTATPTPPPTASPTPVPTLTPAEGTRLAGELASMVLVEIAEEFDDNELTARALDLGVSDADGGYWAVITDGPQPVYLNDDGDPVNFFHIVAVYWLHPDRSWSSEIARVQIESAPQRTADTELVSVAPGTAWIVVRAGTGAHAGTLDVIQFEAARGVLSTALSHVSSRPNAGEIRDLDGDGFPEFVLNTSNPYVFCYVCAVEEHSVSIHRWDGSALVEVPLRAPSGLTGSVATAAARVVSLAEAGLWRQAAALAVATVRRSPGDDGLRWLSILVNQTAALRLAHAGSPGQPLLTNVLAGEYTAALDLIRAHAPSDAFALDGPLITGTAAETDLSTMAVTILGYTERALGQRPDEPAIHAVRALGVALASPDDLARAREAATRAAELAPGDAYLQRVMSYLGGIDRAPGLPPEAPAAEELLPGPTAEWFAEGYTLGSGDRGRLVRALQQRLARTRDLGFLDPGRYYDVYDTATREAVIQIQQQADLEPTGVVDEATWEAVDAAWQQPEAKPAPANVEPSQPAAHDRTGAPVVYLTFDDGPHPTWTPRVLDLLDAYGAPATFFVLGLNATRYPEIVERMVAAGHEAENHTFDHIWLDKAPRDLFVSQVTAADDALHAAAGGRVDPIACLRPPYAAMNEHTRGLAAELGKSIVLWSVDTQDWRRPGEDQIASHVLSNARPGAIILMHDGGGERSQTVAALDAVLEGLTGRGYAFGLLCS
ncbi:MAG: polysaccharide deacetylase family protein [Chloroflexi bacterium]|nr:polysaccharide deacetylase family protein [Chloroflexota bacterium]